MATFQDIDLYSRDNADGTPIIYTGADAIKNALNQWINSKRGEYLMNPGAGGALDNFNFKVLNDDNIILLRAGLLTALVNQFGSAIKVSTVNVFPDYENRITEVEISYSIPDEGISDNLLLFINTQYSNNSFEYEIVDYTGHNLLEFVTIKKPAQSSSRLLYDYDLNSWKWGKYKLVSLVPTDPYFTDILIICNGS